jgi:hypothetical protein
METKHTKIVLVVLAVVGLFVLSSCTANIITEFKSDGSGSFIQEYIMTEDELASASIPTGDDLCTDNMGMDLSTMPAGTTVRQEKDGDEIKCIFESKFNRLSDLNLIYTGTLDSTVNNLAIQDGKLTYDVDVNMGNSDQGTMGFMVYWIVKMPGTVIENNADEQDGNTLKWSLPSGGNVNVRAVSKVSGGNSNWIWWLVGIGGACLCLVLVAAVVVLIVVLVKRNKKKAAEAAMAVPPAPVL